MRSYRTGTTLEFAILLDLPEAEAEAQLENAGAHRRESISITGGRMATGCCAP